MYVVYCILYNVNPPPKRKQPNCLKRAETSVVVIFFDDDSVKTALVLTVFASFINMNQVTEKRYLGE